jgi:ABC-type spermidine/putrescine transport system permease subunit II
MALIECHECHQKISDSARACPKCGASSQQEKHKLPRYILLSGWCIAFLSFLYSVGAIIISLLNRECRLLFSNNTAKLYWNCVGNHLTIYHAGNAFKISAVACILVTILALLINKIIHENEV